MKIDFNMPAIVANNALKTTDRNLSNSMEKLSSGFKVNHAKDNPAGMAIGKKMRAQIEALNKANSNANDAISVIETAEGAMGEIQGMIQRLSELSIKAASETLTQADRNTVQEEVIQLKAEINRVKETTQFNGQPLLDGTFDLKGYSDVPGIELDYYSDYVSLGKYDLEVTALGTYNPDGSVATNAAVTLNATPPNEFPVGTSVTCEGNQVFIKAPGGFEMRVELSTQVTPPQAATLEVSTVGAMRMQIGANEGQFLDIRIPAISLKNLGIDRMDVSTVRGADEAIKMTKNANEFISAARSKIGAYQNRLESTVSSLDITSENMTSAYSRIMDVNMATEMTEYTMLQVLSQAGISVLAQANERPQQILQLLQ